MTVLSMRRIVLLAVILTCAALPPVYAQFSKATVLLSGRVTDAETGQPVRAHVIFSLDGKDINKVLSNAEGKYQAVLHPATTYAVRIIASQRYVVNESVAFPASESSTQVSRDFSVRPIHAGTVMFSGDAFDRGSVSPRDAAASAIAAVGKAMAANNEIEVTLETFSDDAIDDAPVAADQGTQRADALTRILLANGAAANRIAVSAHNPPPAAPAASEQTTGKGKKKKAAPKKKPAPKKPARGKKGVATSPAASKATITIKTVHSEDE